MTVSHSEGVGMAKSTWRRENFESVVVNALVMAGGVWLLNIRSWPEFLIYAAVAACVFALFQIRAKVEAIRFMMEREFVKKLDEEDANRLAQHNARFGEG